jgi:transcriptional regulator with XRE-family HTH domain
MKYKYKRQKAQIKFYTMAKELGIDEKTYKEIEDGKRNLEGNMLDKFMNILKRNKEINFNDAIKVNKINKMVEDKTLMKKITDLGYTQREVAKKIGTSQGTISCMITKTRPVSDETKIKLYDFITNPLNKKLESDKTQKEAVKEEKPNETINTKEKEEKPLDKAKNTVKSDNKKKEAVKIDVEVKLKDFAVVKEMQAKIEKQEKRIATLKRRIMLYEKLIERL